MRKHLFNNDLIKIKFIMMKKYLIFLLGIFFLSQKVNSQAIVFTQQNFDAGSVNFQSSPASSWKINTKYYTSSPNSYIGTVPNKTGDSIILTTPLYNFRAGGYSNILLRFNHICKISPQDIVRIEYKRKSEVWKAIPASAYMGKASNYNTTGFNAKSYSEWKEIDSIALPSQVWWKEELFDMSFEVGLDEEAQFRFILKRGNTAGTQISYGWLLDNFEIIASTEPITIPIVHFNSPLIKGDVYSTGPFTINAKVKTTSITPIKNPLLKYTAKKDGIHIATDFILMNNISGDSIWEATIPQFMAGTEIVYSITGEDIAGNYATEYSGFLIKEARGENSIIVGKNTTYTDYSPIYTRNNYSWSRQLYLAEEISPFSLGGSITKLAWRFFNGSRPNYTYTNQTCYFKVVNDNIVYSGYEDPTSGNATKVWQGSITTSSEGWVEIDLIQPFFLPPGKNLLVYWNNEYGNYTNGIQFSGTAMNSDMAIYESASSSFSDAKMYSGTLTRTRPDARFHIIENTLSNSTSLISIDNPTYATTIAGVPNPVVVTIRNEGKLNLDSADIYWSVNGETPNLYKWKGNLPWDFEKQDTIGYFIPRLDKHDSLLVWTSMPNGKTDSISYDDTLSSIIYGCNNRLGGNYIIAPGKDFDHMSDFFNMINECSINDNITLRIPSGTYDQNWVFSDLDKMIWPYTLTITSEKGHRDSVILKPSSGVAITIENTRNIIFKDITIDATTSNTHGIQLLSNCTNVVIRDCNIKANPTASAETACGIYRSANLTDFIDNLSIINNQIEGGYGSIYINGGTSNLLGTNVTIDSNVITNSYYYGIYLENTKTKSISDNTISSGSSTGINWTGISRKGIYLEINDGGNIVRNRISSDNVNITTALKGMAISNIDNAFIANNEIYLNSKAATTRGIDFEYPKTTELFHNTILLTGSGGTNFQSFYWNIDNNTYWNATIKNNIFIANGGSKFTSYAIYCHTYQSLNPVFQQINSNCYYSSGLNFGYIGNGYSDLSIWKSEVLTDSNSINFFPGFINPATDLRLNTYTNLVCDTIVSVTDDITRTSRPGKLTTMGCYEGIVSNEGAMMLHIIGLREGSIVNEEDSLKAVLLNTGTSTITNVQLSWSYNGTTQTVTKPTSITKGGTDTITLGKIIYPSSSFTVKAWIDNLGTITDLYPNDDTISTFVPICNSAFGGTYLIGTGQTIETISQAIENLKLCGANDDIEFQLISGPPYVENWAFLDLKNIMGPHKLTITSQAKNRNAVNLQPSSDVAILIRNTSNIEFQHLTILALNAKAHAIQILNGCSNVVVDNCNIIVEQNSPSTSKVAAIYRSGTDTLDGLRITNNLLNSGCYGVYLQGSNSNYITNVIIDNNTIPAQYSYPIYLNYVDCKSISSNSLISRSNEPADINWRGIYMDRANGNITNNKIQQQYTTITQPSGIYLSYYCNNSKSKTTGLIANNEIITKGSATNHSYSGIHIIESNAKVFHNSIFTWGTGSIKGIFINNNDGHVAIKNNNISTDPSSTSACPLYITNISSYDINSNNYYAQKNVGYFLGSTISDLTIWKHTLTTDVSSVKSTPRYSSNPASNLNVADPTGLICEIIPPVYTDINGKTRTRGNTTMGCYEAFPSLTENAMLTEIIGLREGFVTGQTDSIKVVLVNAGTTTITDIDLAWLFNGASQTFTKAVTLPPGKADTITLDRITYPQTPFTISVWIEQLNTGGLIDEFPNDDTLTTSVFLCPSGLAGTYTVGKGEDFSELNEAFKFINTCGVADDVTLLLASGTYNRNLIFSDFRNFTGFYNLTITSKAGHRDSVIFKPYWDAGITLEKTQNIIFKAITIDMQNGTHGIRILDSCANLEINNCKILVNLTNNSKSCPVYKENIDYMLDGLSIKNCLLEGGHSGIFLQGFPTDYINNVIIDSNVISNQSQYGIFQQYANSLSIYSNTISSNVSFDGLYHAIYMHYSNGNIQYNKIHQRNITTTYPYGISLQYYHANTSSSTPGIVANNEVIVSSSTAYEGGIYVSNSNARILHNSIYVGGIGASKGISISQDRIHLEIKNNLISMESSTAYPMYFFQTTNAGNWDINSNNYYAPIYIGGTLSTNITDWNTWRQLIATDVKSTNISPDFINNTTDLKLSDYTKLMCEAISPVHNDIEMNSRTTITTMGCYEGIPSLNGNAMLAEIIGLRDGSISGQSDSVKVVLVNLGATTITEVNLGWSFNGVTQQSVPKSVSIPQGKQDTITLNKILYPSLPFITTVWINHLNAGSLIDQHPDDDTVSISTYICSSGLSGEYTVGIGGNFEDLSQALNVINTCGATDDIQLGLISGTYTKNWKIQDFGSVMGSHILTITSKAKHRDSVMLKTSGVGITLKDASNLTFEAITIDAASNGTHGVELLNNCKNIAINNCAIFVDSISSNPHAAIYKGIISDIVSNIRIWNNFLNGGYYGIYLDGNATKHIENVAIDSNILSNQYYYGIYPKNTDCISISYNTIVSRINNAGSSWGGINMEYSSGNVIGNKIRQRATIITSQTGIYLNRYHNSKEMGLVANNEIIINATGTGIYNVNSNAKILHNSIYIGGSAAAKGIHIENNNVHLEIKNNNIVTTSSTSYPMYLAGKTYLSQWDINSNNYWGQANVGYVSGTVASDLSTWKQTVTTDTASRKSPPRLLNPNLHLNVNDSTGISCSILSPVYYDINKRVRTGAITTMGCHEAIPSFTGNAMLTEFTGLRIGSITGQNDSVRVILINTGTTTITEINFGWIFNGQEQSSVTKSVQIPQGKIDTIALDRIIYPASTFSITAWINNLNAGELIDQYPNDDTISISLQVCSPLQGGYTVGAGEYFESLDEAFNTLGYCGAAGDVDFQLASKIYTQGLTFSNFGDIMGPYRLTITSKAGHRDSVVFQLASGNVITLNNVRNFGFSKITIDAKKGDGISLSACTNLLIDNCAILLDSASNTYARYYGFYKPANTGSDSLFITNNLIQGGFYGIFLQGGSTNYTKNVILANNTISSQHQQAVYLSYIDGILLENNNILTRILDTNISEYWTGVSISNSNGNVIGNKVIQRNMKIISPTGIGLSSFNNNTTVPGLVANNEIIIYPTATINIQYGLSISNSNVKVLHNSIYVGGTSSANGISIGNTNNKLEVKNNIITMNSSGAYPILLAGTTYLSQWDINSNNYSAPQYIGGIGTTPVGIGNLNTWRKTVSTDVLSVNILPDFIDSTINLKLSDYNPFKCLAHPDIKTDIEGTSRQQITAMGAYSFDNFSASDVLNVVLNHYNWKNETVLNMDQLVQTAVTNKSFISVNNLTLKWILNDVPQTPYTWSTSTSLEYGENINFMMNLFTITQDTNKIEVWIDSVNNTPYNGDTITAICYNVPLANFAAPFIADTIDQLSFNIYTKIMDGSGATITTPQMEIRTIISDTVFKDTIPLYYSNGLWTAAVPKQYYGAKIIYSMTIHDTVGNTITLIDSTYLKFNPLGERYSGYNLSILSIEEIMPEEIFCTPDYASVKIVLKNMGENDYDFSQDQIKLSLKITSPEPFYKETILTSGKLKSGKDTTIEITNLLPIMVAGQYDITTWVDSPVDNIIYDDTLSLNYISGKFGLPVDEDFSSPTPMGFIITGNNTNNKWTVIPQGIGADTVVKPVFGTGMISFSGTPGATSILSTRQLDLSRTIDPSLSFWYFHDTIPGDDYTDVNITIDGGTTYTTLFPLTKYNPVYGWKEYTTELPSFAINQCVFLVFEAMEKSRDGDVTQYIDRITITSSQNLSLDTILLPELSVCDDLTEHELKVVLSNTTNQKIDFTNAPMELHIDINGTVKDKLTYSLSGTMNGLKTDTIIITSDFDFSKKGIYDMKAYISTLASDFNRKDDTTTIKIEINPKIEIALSRASGGSTNCALAGSLISQAVTIKNTGNMDIPSIELILQIDTGEARSSLYFLSKEILSESIAPGKTIVYDFKNNYTIPWNANYQVFATAYLPCDSAFVNNQASITECVDIDDIAVVNIDKPNEQIDKVGSNINIEVSLENKSDVKSFTNVNINVMIEDSKGEVKSTFTEAGPSIGTLKTIQHTLNNQYIVPNDSIYYITVFVTNGTGSSLDNYAHNDTLRTKRITDYTGVGTQTINQSVFYMGQNTPNPSTNSTMIGYRIPQSGEVIFRIHNMNGQILYNKVIQSEQGYQSIEINTSALSSGIYMYSMEFNGQRITKRMSIKR